MSLISQFSKNLLRLHRQRKGDKINTRKFSSLVIQVTYPKEYHFLTSLVKKSTTVIGLDLLK